MNNQIHIEDANPVNIAECSVHLKVSGEPISNVGIVSISSISEGYLKGDKRVTINLDESIIEDGYYTINKGSIISINDFCKGISENFEIDGISEVSNKTSIVLYGKEKMFKDFFSGDYIVGNVSCYNIFSTVDVENLNSFCKEPSYNINNVTKDSMDLVISNPQGEYNKYYIKYRKFNEATFEKITSTDTTVTLSGLEEDTLYEIQVCASCSTRYTSFYTPSRLGRTL